MIKKSPEESFLGSPAHAGIDPALIYSDTAGDWFPRTRGDRPSLPKVAPPGSGVPPHTRG